MNTGRYDLAVQRDGPTVANDQIRLRQRWSVVTSLLVAAVFIEAVSAGAMLSGFDWARAAHSVNAAVLVASTISAGLVSVVTLRSVPHGPRLGWTLLSLASLVFAQAAAGALAAKGANLLWIHVPLGVAVFGLAVRAASSARKLGGT